MIQLLSVLCFAIYFHPFDLLSLLAKISAAFHLTCLELLPRSSFDHYHAAIVCGQNLSNPQIQNLWQSSGLIHLLVVSASHLQFFWQFQLLSRTSHSKLGRIVSLLTLLAVFIFSLMTSMQPPILRALAQGFWILLNRHFLLLWTPQTILLLSGLVTLSLSESLHSSLSLQLSWVAASTLCWSQQTRSCERVYLDLRTHLKMYLFMQPLLISYSLSQPTTVLLNASLGPLIGFVMFPLDFASLYLHSLVNISDPTWKIIEHLLKLHQAEFPMAVDVAENRNLLYGWLYVASLQTYFLWFELRSARGRAYLTSRLRSDPR